MAIDALTRACICHALIQDPGATVCEKCSRVLVPHHSQWPPVLRWWLLAELAGTRFLPWKAAQEVWEELLNDNFVTPGARETCRCARNRPGSRPAPLFSANGRKIRAYLGACARTAA